MISVVVVTEAGFGGGRTPAAKTVADDAMVLSSLDTSLSRQAGKMLHEGELFSGFVKTENSIGDVLVAPYEMGVKEGQEHSSYADGSLKHVRTWKMGKREGEFLSYWPDGQLKQAHFYEDDLLDGRIEEWFSTGQQFKSFSYENGKEAGPQKLWYEDGTLRANYVVLDGRRYGSIGTKGCVSESNE